MSEAHFCLQCGTRMETVNLDGRERERCPACGWVHYMHLRVAAAVLIEQADELLLLQRANPPWQGAWNLPAGYVEVDEKPEDAAEREVREETGLQVQVGELAGQYFYNDDPRGNGLILVFRCQVVGGNLTPNEESSDIGFFPAGRLPAPLCGAGHKRAVADWLRRVKA